MDRVDRRSVKPMRCRWTIRVLASAVATLAIGACTDGPDRAGGSGTERPPPETTDSIVPSSISAEPGEELSLSFRPNVLRSVGFQLSRWSGEAWSSPDYLLISDGGGSYDCGDCPKAIGRDQDWAIDYIAVGGPGPDRIVLPREAPAGHYRGCAAGLRNSDPPCFQVEIVDRPSR